MKDHYQIIIVGAGPAGLATALHLQRYGLTDLLVIDKKTFPRYKCCAGYITGKTKLAYEALGLDIGSCHYSLIEDFHIFYRLRRRQTIPNRFLYTNQKIDRVELDYAFFQFAKRKGIEILEDTYIKEHTPTESRIHLNNGNVLSYEHLIFADGTTGFGSRYQNPKRCNIAMQVIFPSALPDSIDIHFGITPKGYAWVSTYHGLTNVGLTDVYTHDRDYRGIFREFLEYLGLNCDLRDLHAAFTPIGTNPPILFGNVYFVGDAAGACDPLTLSGLRYGLKSGEICARAIRAGNKAIYTRYIRNLGLRFKAMALIQRLFYRKPILWLIFNVGCRYFGGLVAYVFNHFFVNKK